MLSSSSIKFSYWLSFSQVLGFYFKRLRDDFREFLINKAYSVAQVSINIIILILFHSVYRIQKGLLQNRFSGMDNKETNTLLFLTLKRAILFFHYCCFE